MKLKKIIGIVFFLIVFLFPSFVYSAAVCYESVPGKLTGEFSIVMGSFYMTGNTPESVCNDAQHPPPPGGVAPYSYSASGFTCKLIGISPATMGLTASYPITALGVTYICPAGYTRQGSDCFPPPTCITCSNGSTAPTLALCPASVTCPDGSTAPTLAECPCDVNNATMTSSGTDQTIHWNTRNATNVCVSNSLTCTFPNVANLVTRACDIKCDDGNTVTPPMQCIPPSCPNQLNGSIITVRTWDSVTKSCKNTGIVRCDSQLQVPDVQNGVCLPKPGAKDCGNKTVVIFPVKCSSEPDHSRAIYCANGLIIYPPRVCSPEPPDIKNCPAGTVTTGYLNGVPQCIKGDGTSTDTNNGATTASGSDGQDPPNEQNNPQGFKGGVACDSQYSFPCDPSLPVVPVGGGVTGIEKCGPGTMFTCVDVHDKPIVPDIHSNGNAVTTRTGTTKTTTTTNPDGSTTSFTESTDVGSTTGKSTTDCPDCAKETTLQEIAKSLTSTKGLSSYSVGTANGGNFQKGNFNDDSENGQAAIDEVKGLLNDKMTEVKTGVSGIFSGSVTNGSGALPRFDFGNMKGVNVVLDMNQYSSELSVVSSVILAMAWVVALSIILSRS